MQIQYDGTDYSGWQYQPDAITIQGEIQKVLRQFGIEELPTAAGRTDAGVHARKMTAHVHADSNFRVPIEKVASVITNKLPAGIIVNSASIEPDEKFHARFSAIARRYTYSLHTKPDVFIERFSTFHTMPIDWKLLKAAASIFRVRTDFTTFSKINPAIKNNICDIQICQWTQINLNQYQLEIKADHFLYGMVRSLVGAMLDVARGKRSLDDLRKALLAKDRSQNSPLAPPQGLVFEQAYYL
jgi:tRNA pseudouridine38-40 synthase